jgi:hypothetical protein
MTESDLYRRATVIEELVQEHYVNADAADLALDELRQDPNRTDMEIARIVAQRILQA